MPEVRRNLPLAWEDYRLGNIVSEHAARLIKSFLMTQMDETNEKHEDEEEEKPAKNTVEEISTSWASVEKIKEILEKEH